MPLGRRRVGIRNAIFLMFPAGLKSFQEAHAILPYATVDE
jgi:hypothetical protein